MPQSERAIGVPLLPADAPPLRGVEERGGRVNNLYRSLANQPVLLEAWTNFAWTLRAQCAVPRTLRELLILRAAQLQSSEYIWRDHVRFGLDAGLSQAEIDELARWRTSGLYGERERLALEFAEQVVAGHVEDGLLAELGRHFDAGEQVELALTVSFYTLAPRVIDALRVPLPD